MSTIARGNAAEAHVIAALAEAGIPTLLPFGEGWPFDIAVWLPDNSVLRIQVRCGWVGNNVVKFNSHSTDHGRGALDYANRADVFGVYVPALRRVFMVPVDDCPKTKGWLRLEPTRNNQRLRIRMAEDYTFERWAESVVALPKAA